MATITDSIVQVTTYADPFWTQTTTLDGTPFQLQFDYNQRCDTYYLSVYTLEGAPVYLGVKVICNSLLLRKCADIDNAPAGDFWCASNTTDDTPPGLGDLGPGGRCILCYIPVDLLP